ncbi:DUF1194 domain-containing protein [Shimia abyssi]|uniref:Uncharacterized protein DUF1194 n=1 Tax=Shimia abyssi TaxID=1662395 RepID=A0A2P8FJC1_9RHOB|nr:DUF1194 domain-containing protein [Shimia abyssi]PSL21798.1 uncharacterized protein DUF1194 [Shimia abyssi]
MIRALATVGLALVCQPALAVECRLALVLALDVSSSVDDTEDAFQRRGLASALIAPEVRAAILGAPQPIALAVFEWSGRYNQKLLLDWALIESSSTLNAAAKIIATSERSTKEFPTALGHAMGYAAGLLRRAPDCHAKTIDVSGDGKNNEGYMPQQAYAHFPFNGVTVNGLAIETAGTTGAAFSNLPTTIADYYWENLLHGPGAFLEIADGFEDFERAMRRKLERELRPAALSQLVTPP